MAGITAAVALHLAVAAAWLWQAPEHGTVATGAGGLQVGLASAGRPAGAAGDSAPEIAEVARPAAAESQMPPDSDSNDPPPAEVIEAAPVQSAAPAKPEIAEVAATDPAAETTSVKPAREILSEPVEIAAAVEPESPKPSIEPVFEQPVTVAQVPDRQTEAAAKPVQPVEPETIGAQEVEAAAVARTGLVEAETAEAKPLAEEPTETARVAPRPPVPAPPVDRPVRNTVRLRQAEPKESLPVKAATSTADAIESKSVEAETGPETTAAAPESGDGRLAALPGAQGKSGPRSDSGAGSQSGQQQGGGSPGQRADFLAQLQLWLERHKKYPRMAQRRRQEGTAQLYFVMRRDGTVIDFRIEQSSGHRLLDQEVEAMIQRAQPLPQMPDFYPGSRLELVVPIVFSMR
ncbi:MAG: TonB family protein [Minwuia sp.]|uniref:energy transducer TonB n=1 Tax=Minwuia sp. TaxID=2493630 RepID=UPI003A83E452